MLRKAILGFVASVGVLAAVEVGLRLFLPLDTLLFSWERPTGMISRNEAGGMVTRPGMAEERDDGPYRWATSLNALGLREDDEVPAKKPPGTYRILAIGDSWMYGFSVSQGHTIPDVLEDILPAKLGQPVEVINAGVFGSCAFDMLARYRQFVDAYEIDGVLLGQPHNAGRLQRVEAERSAWYRAYRDGPASTARLYLLTRRALAPLRSGTYAAPPKGTGQQAEIADLRLLALDAKARGLPVWFAEFPDQMDHGLRGFSGSPAWRKGLADAGVRFGGHALGERACWAFVDAGHPGESGAYVIADALSDVIATGASLDTIRITPRCADVAAAGPGKPGWPLP